MNRFNAYMSSHYSGCKLIAESEDLFRKRPVRLYLIPGEFEVIGVSDGTDAWIAPVVPQCFRVDVADIVKRIRAGESVPVIRTASRRRVTLVEEEPEPAPRRRVLLEEEPQPRRRRIVLEN